MRSILIALCLFPLLLVAQQKEEQLAAQYFGNNEFDKAVELYEKLIAQKPESGYIYDNLLACYLNLKQYNEAERMVKKQQKRFPENAFYQVDFGYIIAQSGQTDKSEKVLNELIQKLKGTEQETISLANAFQKRRYQSKAIDTYLRARKLNGGSTSLFAIPLAQLYAFNNQLALMIEEYLNALMWEPRYLEDISGYLQNYIEQPQEFDLLKSALLKRIKQYPDQESLSELMVWLYVQRKDFDQALTQTKAIEKRKKENGTRSLELGQIALQNESYDAAIQIFTYVVSLGSSNSNYTNAQALLIESRKQKIVTTGQYTEQDLLVLESEYKNFINENGKYYFTASTMRELARLYAYHMQRLPDAIDIFKELVTMPRIEAKFAAECKLELGDIYLLKGEEWESMLLYGQVDKDYKEDPLGQEAKFRNARLSYYLGEFEWARAQLDVLKTATTQLISNNALELSLLIQDHTIDSVEEPLKLFAQADLMIYQNNFTSAIQLLDSLQKTYPRHTLEGPVVFKRAIIALKQKKYSEAASYFERVTKEHATGVLGDNALFEWALLSEKQLNDKPKALELYTKFLSEYPGSFFTTEVRKRFRILRGDSIN